MASYTNWEKFYQKLNMIFHGIVASTLIPFAWVFLETQKEHPDGPLVAESVMLPLEILLVGLSAILIAFSRILSKRGLKKVWVKETIKEKLEAYLSVKIRLYAVIESAALLALIGLFLTKVQFFTVIYLIVLFVFSLQRPTFDRVRRETGVKEKELKEWGSASED